MSTLKELLNMKNDNTTSKNSERSGLNLVAYAVVNTVKRNTRIKLQTDQ